MNSLFKSEDRLQQDCIMWAWNEMPMTRFLIFHVPNGGSRNKIEAALMKAKGVISGIPDLIFIWAGRIYPFELKVGNNTSENQKRVKEIWEKNYVHIKEIRTLEDFKTNINQIIYNN